MRIKIKSYKNVKKNKNFYKVGIQTLIIINKIFNCVIKILKPTKKF